MPYFFPIPALTPTIPFRQSLLISYFYVVPLHKQGSLKATRVFLSFFLDERVPQKNANLRKTKITRSTGPDSDWWPNRSWTCRETSRIRYIHPHHARARRYYPSYTIINKLKVGATPANNECVAKLTHKMMSNTCRKVLSLPLRHHPWETWVLPSILRRHVPCMHGKWPPSAIRGTLLNPCIHATFSILTGILNTTQGCIYGATAGGYWENHLNYTCALLPIWATLGCVWDLSCNTDTLTQQ